MSSVPFQHFNDLRLPESVTRALRELQFQTPTPVQLAAIPVGLSGKDLIACAQTGTGKTAAYCIPLLSRMLQDSQALGLVLAPTRELVHQIEAFWNQLTRFTPGVGAVSLIGGVSMQPQIKGLRRNPRLVIATPGRLIDHLERRTLHLDRTAILVLDEADRMLDMGFAPQLNRVLSYLPKRRQTLFFSATFPREAEQLSSRYLHQPERVQVGSISRAAPKVEQSYVRTKHPLKNAQVFDELVATQGSVIVFARTQHRTDRLARYLEQGGLPVGRIHGGRSQAQRTSALNAFRGGDLRVLVATEIAARGLDIPHVGTVINYDLPMVAEDYIHRIGRTARAGASGQALSYVTPEEHSQWRDILALLKKSGSTSPAERAVSAEAAATPVGAPAAAPAFHNRRFSDTPSGGSRDNGNRPQGRDSRGANGNRPHANRPQGNRPHGNRNERKRSFYAS